MKLSIFCRKNLFNILLLINSSYSVFSVRSVVSFYSRLRRYNDFTVLCYKHFKVCHCERSACPACHACHACPERSVGWWSDMWGICPCRLQSVVCGPPSRGLLRRCAPRNDNGIVLRSSGCFKGNVPSAALNPTLAIAFFCVLLCAL